MRNRLNVIWLGKRTTARFPDYLWRLALVASGRDDETMAQKLREFLASCDMAEKTASEIAQSYLVNWIEMELFSAGFNPGNSRAPDTGKAPPVKAAEARPTKGKH